MKSSNSIKTGLRFRKLDLHVHTPTSDDYSDKKVTASDIVESAIAADLAAIAITDHQTGDGIDSIREAAKDLPLVIFPGVELLVTGGEEGIHIVCLFDTDKDSSHINQFLNSLQVYDKNGKRTLCTELSVGQVADILNKYDRSAILVLAHCHSSKGVLGDMKGETRTAIFEHPRPALLGAETSEQNFTDEDKKAQGKRVVDVLNGKDKNYGYRRLGIYQSSDAHLPSEIGQAYSYFKVDRDITIEDIRQCLVDRETRIRQPHEYASHTYPAIMQLEITGGFLDNQSFVFNTGLNSLLGAKGSGKSLAVEFLRFALNQSPINSGLSADHEQKLEKCLGTYGKISVRIRDDSGKHYSIEREYQPAENSPIKIMDLDDGLEKTFDVGESFPVLFLSQNEVIRIAEDRLGKEQRRFIDRFFDFQRYVKDSERVLQTLLETDRRFAEALRAHYKVLEVERSKQTLVEQKKKLGRQLTNRAFDEYQKKEAIGQAVKNFKAYLEDLKNYLIQVKEQLVDLSPPPMDDANAKDDPVVKRSIDHSKKTHLDVLNGLDALVKLAETGITRVDTEEKEFEKSFQPIKEKYDNLVKEAGGTEVALSEKRKRVVNQIQKLDKEIASLKGKASQLKSLTEQRKTIIGNLDAIRKEYFNERKQRCDFFNESSGGTLRVTMAERADTSEFENNLLKFKRGSWLRDEEMQQIAKTIEPNEFIRLVLAFEWRGREKGQATQTAARATGIDEEKINKLFIHLLDEFSYEDILGLQYKSMPDDKPTIEYKVEYEYKDLSNLSIGQKSVALLIMALSEGDFPIIIDQPEDSLDLRSIWEDVCRKVRISKEMRQFIFTTHNSSVAVASDTDNYSILESDASRGKVIISGSMNNPKIRDNVIKYLEGGKDTYLHKGQKYNL